MKLYLRNIQLLKSAIFIARLAATEVDMHEGYKGSGKDSPWLKRKAGRFTSSSWMGGRKSHKRYGGWPGRYQDEDTRLKLQRVRVPLSNPET
jgi:hypothetical protein